jgi:REP element-mobilizing transposase RayT
MATNILVVTTSAAVADTIYTSLNDTGPFRVRIVNNKAAAIVKADEDGCSVAILDLDLGENQVTDVGQALRTINSSIKLIVLCQDETPPALDGIRPWTLLRKPMLLRELIETLDQPSTTTAEAEPELPWLQDVNKAAQYLTRITLESSAQAALITHKNSLWAYAGGLSQDAGNEVAQTVSRNWDGQKSSDLLRFVRLESTKAEHMLYATRLAADLILALVFDAETPFSTIRSQANQLISTLVEEKVAEPVVESGPASKLSQLISGATSEIADIDDLEYDEDEIEIPPISNILTNIPSPDPEPFTGIKKDESVISKILAATQTAPTEGDLPAVETRRSTLFSNLTAFRREPAPAAPPKEFVVADEEEAPAADQTVPSSGRMDELEVTVPAKLRRPETPLRRPEADELDVTRPTPSTDASRRAQFEPISAGMYHLTYACLLVPRFTSHYLTGDLADRLAEWLPKICIAFGWRLEFLAVRPEYLQWVVNVQPNTSPGYLMKVMRQHTSEKIFTEFLRIRKENPSGDFWAPGYLIMGGTQPHPPQLVKDYIKQTRERQGVSRPPAK